ncbi:MAG: hypothetical protein HY703_10675 [Gemmatimonadetes bacterium]|nr:hypothetical protein [Gemmatimonadota bacterium]
MIELCEGVPAFHGTTMVMLTSAKIEIALNQGLGEEARQGRLWIILRSACRQDCSAGSKRRARRYGSNGGRALRARWPNPPMSVQWPRRIVVRMM